MCLDVTVTRMPQVSWHLNVLHSIWDRIYIVAKSSKKLAKSKAVSEQHPPKEEIARLGHRRTECFCLNLESGEWLVNFPKMGRSKNILPPQKPCFTFQATLAIIFYSTWLKQYWKVTSDHWCWNFLGARLCSYRKVDHVGMQPSNDLQGPEEKIVKSPTKTHPEIHRNPSSRFNVYKTLW